MTETATIQDELMELRHRIVRLENRILHGSGGYNRVSYETWSMAKELFNSGDSIAKIARTLNRPRATVQNMLSKTEDEIIKTANRGAKGRKTS